MAELIVRQAEEDGETFWNAGIPRAEWAADYFTQPEALENGCKKLKRLEEG